MPYCVLQLGFQAAFPQGLESRLRSVARVSELFQLSFRHDPLAQKPQGLSSTQNFKPSRCCHRRARSAACPPAPRCRARVQALTAVPYANNNPVNVKRYRT